MYICPPAHQASQTFKLYHSNNKLSNIIGQSNEVFKTDSICIAIGEFKIYILTLICQPIRKQCVIGIYFSYMGRNTCKILIECFAIFKTFADDNNINIKVELKFPLKDMDNLTPIRKSMLYVFCFCVSLHC